MPYLSHHAANRTRADDAARYDNQRARRARAKGIRTGRQMLRDGFTRLEVMRHSWRCLDRVDSEIQRSFVVGLQDAVAHDRKMS